MKLPQAMVPSAQAQERATDRAEARSTGSVVIPFPGARARDAAPGQPVPDPSDGPSSEEPQGPPAWKEQLRERVRAIRERRGEGPPEPARRAMDAESVPPSGAHPASASAKERRALAETTVTRARQSNLEPARSSENANDLPNPSPRESAGPQERALPMEPPVAGEGTQLREAIEDFDLDVEGEAERFGSERSAFARPRSEAALWLPREEAVEQIAPASLARRLGAALIDLGVIAFSTIPFVAAVEIVYGDLSQRLVRIALVGTAAVVGILYEVIMLSVAGRTVGMAIAGLLALNARTMDVPSAGQAVRHILGTVLGALPLFFGFFWALFNRERRTFADLLAGIVVKRVAESVYESQEIHAPWLYRPVRRRCAAGQRSESQP